jgi:hypothetical protein
MAAPFILKAQDKAGTQLRLIGDGDHKYEVIHDWGVLPNQLHTEIPMRCAKTPMGERWPSSANRGRQPNPCLLLH